MTSEVFKEKLPGAVIFVAGDGRSTLELLHSCEPSLVIIDFDLPDTDGVSLTKLIRSRYAGPILMTAFSTPVVDDAISAELFAYNDSNDWIRKPLKFSDLATKIDEYMTPGKRLRKRFATQLPALLTGKGAGRGKRAPKSRGTLVSLSIGGALVRLDEASKMKVGDEISVALPAPIAYRGVQQQANNPPSQLIALESLVVPESTADEQTPIAKAILKTKATILWQGRNRKDICLLFHALPEVCRVGLETWMRQATPIISSPPVREKSEST